MDLSEIQKAIRRVIKKHYSVLQELGAKQSSLLELAALTGFVEHYKSQGSSALLVNGEGKRQFAIKMSTKGDPWNFSKFLIEGEHEPVEVHMNLKVRSAHDMGIYCVDIGVVNALKIPRIKIKSRKWECADNEDLVTFGEAKKLVIYPMLLAQFIGIVHELHPRCIDGFCPTIPHPAPVLIALGNFSANANVVVTNYSQRNIHVTIAENYDIRLARVRRDKGGSPFWQEPEIPIGEITIRSEYVVKDK